MLDNPRDALDGLILIQAVQAAFSTVSTLLDSTERCLGGRDLACVDSHHADLELTGNYSSQGLGGNFSYVTAGRLATTS